MTRSDFLHMIEDKGPVNRQMMGELYELIDIFPYFQSAHMLLLKGLQDNADVKFENQLRHSAIHAADREVLYYLLNRRTAYAAETQKDAEQEDKSEPAEEVVAKETEVHNAETTEDISGEETSDTHQTVIESARNSEYLINEIENSSDENNSDQRDESGSKASGHTILLSSGNDEDEAEGVLIIRDEEPVITEDQVFYMDPGFSVPEKGELLEIDSLDDKGKDSVEEGVITDQSDPKKKTDKRLIQSELIEKFIIANPRIEPVRDKTNPLPVDLSKPYVEAEGSLVTETLARIYVNQGYYSRAIDIYEKLSLKFPEKSSYFAAQIEKVKEHLKK